MIFETFGFLLGSLVAYIVIKLIIFPTIDMMIKSYKNEIKKDIDDCFSCGSFVDKVKGGTKNEIKRDDKKHIQA